MIYVSENKAQIVKGDFHPAKLYKGDKKIAGYKKETFEGEGTVTLENCYNDKLHNACIFGNSLQESVPSPEEPVEIKSVGDLVTEGEYSGKYRISATAKNTENLFDKNNPNILNVTVSAEKYISPHSVSRFVWIEIKPDTTYKVTKLPQHTICALSSKEPKEYDFVDARYTVSELGGAMAEFTITSEENHRYLLVGIVASSGGGYSEQEMIDSLVIQSDSSGGYSFNIYLGEPLRKVGNYEDYIDFENKKVIRNTNSKAFAGTENWLRENYRLYTQVGRKTDIFSDEINCISNRFNSYSWTDLYKNSFLTSKKIGVALQSGSYICVTPAQVMPSIEEWKEQLSAWDEEGAPLTVIYADTVREESIDLPELPTFRGTTIYEIDTETTAKISGAYKRVE